MRVHSALTGAAIACCGFDAIAAARDCLPLFPPAYAVDGEPRAVALGDLDGDGDLDIVTANFGQSLSILFNQGGGVFGRSTAITGVGAETVVLADLEGDGDLDIVLGRSPVTMLLNEGGGAFGAPQPAGTLSAAKIAVGDMDADGDLDIVAAFSSFEPGQPMLVNQGDGTFELATFCADADGTDFDIALGDFNGDGLPDTIAPAGLTDAVVAMNSGGMCGDVTTYRAGLDTTAVDTGDIDADGDVDAVVVSRFVTELASLINQGGGEFLVDTLLEFQETSFDVALGDLDGDGDADAALGGEHTLRISVNSGPGRGGVFAPTIPMASGYLFRAVAAGDLDGNGIDDMVAAHASRNEVVVLLNPCAARPGDLDGDGAVDGGDLGLLLGNWGQCPPPNNPCPSDLDGNGTTDGADLGVLIGAWTG